MHDYSKYVRITPCSETPRLFIGRSFSERIVAWFMDFFLIAERPEGRGRIVRGKPPQFSNLPGYHAPCYPQEQVQLLPAVEHCDAQEPMDSFKIRQGRNTI